MKNIAILTLVLFSIVGCNKSNDVKPVYAEDKIAPKIDVISPVDSTNIICSSNIYLTATFTDETALKYCVISIKKISDLKGLDISWTPVNDTIKMEGKSFSVTDKLILATIPYNASLGSYNLNLDLYDMNNNVVNQNIKLIIPF